MKKASFLAVFAVLASGSLVFGQGRAEFNFPPDPDFVVVEYLEYVGSDGRDSEGRIMNAHLLVQIFGDGRVESSRLSPVETKARAIQRRQLTYVELQDMLSTFYEFGLFDYNEETVKSREQERDFLYTVKGGPRIAVNLERYVRANGTAVEGFQKVIQTEASCYRAERAPQIKELRGVCDAIGLFHDSFLNSQG